MLLLLEILAVILLLDFVTGFFHWLEDAYGDENTPLIGKYIIAPNIKHHHFPRAFITNGYFLNARDLMAAGAVILLGAWALDLLTWHVWLFVLLGVNANQFHKWAHRSRKENGPIINALHRYRILQDAKHHGGHHRGRHNTHLCVMTCVLNPVLDRMRFWDGLSFVIGKVTGLKPREDHKGLHA